LDASKPVEKDIFERAVNAEGAEVRKGIPSLRDSALLCTATGQNRSQAAWISRSADFQSAVSPSCTRQTVRITQEPGNARQPAECNSAVRQSSTLRYFGCVFA